MGRILLVCRLVLRDLRHRPAEAALLLLAITAATATLSLGLAMNGVSDQPYLRTRAATNGPDMVVTTSGQNQPESPSAVATSNAAELADLHTYETAPGVTAFDGPYPSASPTMTFRGITVVVDAEGRDTTPAPIDQPDVTQGTWVRTGGVVVERTFAEALKVNVGDSVALNGKPFQVVGIAVSAASPPYPYGDPIWVTQADALSFVSPTQPVDYYSLNLKLADPAGAEAFENAHQNDSDVYLSSWQDINQQDQQVFGAMENSLLIGSWLLGMLAIAGVAVLVGGRMANQTRRVGLLKAVGATPGLVAFVLLAENLFLALAAAVVGLAAGWLAAPLLTAPGAALLGTASAPSLSLTSIGVVVAVALAVAIIATLVPALRAARTSTVRALADSAHGPRRRARLIALSARLPVSLLLGLRLAARRPKRSVLSVLSTVVTVCGIIAVLSSIRTHELNPAGGQSALDNPRMDLQAKVLLIIAVMLVVLTAVNAVLTIWAGSLDSTRPLAVARALGATPFQVGAGLSAAQLLPALLGSVLGVPAGLGLVSVASSSHGKATALPPALWLIGVVLGTPIIMAALTAIPARIGARRPVADILQSELA